MSEDGEEMMELSSVLPGGELVWISALYDNHALQWGVRLLVCHLSSCEGEGSLREDWFGAFC